MSKIVFTGPFSEHSGYSSLNRGFIKHLFQRGYDVGIENIYCPMELTREEWYWYKKFEKPGIGKDKLYLDFQNIIKVISWLPLDDMPRFKNNLLYTMAESRDINPIWTEVINRNYDRILTPTRYYAERFQESKIDKPVHVVPIGVDDIFKKENIVENSDISYEVFSKRISPIIPDGYRFFSVFRWSYRKGADVLIKAFLREFTYKDNVSLCLMSRHAACSLEQRFYDALRQYLLELVDENATSDSPPIYLNCEVIEQKYMPTVYSRNNCFVSTSRGEGQSLPPLEASLMGLPVIAPIHTGLSDYVSQDTAFSFDVDSWEVPNENHKWKEWITPSYSYQEFPVFGDKTIEEVGSLMRYAMDHSEEGSAKNKKMQELISENYTWDKSIDSFEEMYRQIT